MDVLVGIAVVAFIGFIAYKVRQSAKKPKGTGSGGGGSGPPTRQN